MSKIQEYNQSNLSRTTYKRIKEQRSFIQYAVDEHIKDCEAENIEPEKSYKGSFNVRISPELHRRIAVSAKMHGVFINKFVSEVLNQTVTH
jgi:predicted HicB family RNase H-like nuclease